jgi:Spy/CpxP family protein refolding chaperone
MALIPVSAFGCQRHRHHASEAEIKEHTREASEWILDTVDATDAQTEKVGDVLDQAVAHQIILRPERKALTDELLNALTQDSVDGDAIEALRTRGLELLDRASARGTRALVEAAQQLDVEQRKTLVARFRKRHDG